MNSKMIIDWTTLIDDDKLSKLTQGGYLVLDDVFCQRFLTNLQTESGFSRYKEATLAKGERVASIRGDRICWIDESYPAGYAYLRAMEALGRYFNRTLFVGISHSEAHYACYPVGFGYEWHSDNPKGRDERVLSAVYYLNDDWQCDDGGELEVIDKLGQAVRLLPKANRLVIFDSNLRHKVHTTARVRYSIATWLRRH